MSMADREERDGLVDQSVSAEVPQASQDLFEKNHCQFSGSYTHGIDNKGRMIVPACFRARLGDKFVVALTPDFKTIALYPTDEWFREQEKLEKLSEQDARAERLIAMFNKYSYPDSETDAQGRLLLPVKMRMKYLGSAKNLEISGAKRYIRVMDEVQGDREDAEFERDIPDPLSFMAELQKNKKE